MVFKKLMLIPGVLIIFILVGIFWRFQVKADSTTQENIEPTLAAPEVLPEKVADINISKEEDDEIQKQFDRDRAEQQQTKYLKTKLEQTNLELDQEKAIAEINKLKMENGGVFYDTNLEGHKKFPEIKVEYIGGDKLKKEAILSIAGINYQVRERSFPTDNIQVVSISDTGVTVHFNAPQALTKTIDYKPE